MEKQLRFLFLILFFLPFGTAAQVTFTAVPPGTVNCDDNSFSVDIIVDNFTNVNAFQYTIHWDPAVLDQTSFSNNTFGVSLGSTPAQLDNGFTQVSYFSTSGSTTIPNGTVLFTINFDLIGNAGTTLISFDGNPTPIQIVQNGNPIGPSQYAFANGTINILDNNAPTVSCPADITVDAGSATSAQVGSISPSGTDNCGIDNYTYSLSGATSGTGTGDVSNLIDFNVGTTTVTYTAVDFGGNNSVPCSFNITVENTVVIGTDLEIFAEDVTVNCEDNLVSVDIIANNFTDLKGAQFTMNWPSNVLQYIDHDNIVFTSGTSFGTMNSANGILTFSWFNSTPTSFPNGQVLFTINFSVNAPAGITIPVIFINSPTPIQFIDENTMEIPASEYTVTNGSVLIFDNENPTISCPNNVAITSTNGTNAILNNIQPTTNDNCGIADTTYTLTGATTGSGTGDASGTTFNLGVTTVDYTITDFDGNSATCSFEVEVTTQPVSLINVNIDSLIVNCDDNTAQACIRVENFNDIRGIQFTVNFDAIGLEYVDTSNIAFTSGFSFGTSNVSTGQITFSWFSANTPVNFADGSSLFCINFNLNNPTPGDSYDIDFSNVPTPFQIATQSSLPGFLPPSQYVIANGNIMVADDNEMPTLTCPVSTTVNSGGFSTAIVNGISPTVMDNCGEPDTTYTLTGATTGSGTGDASGTTFNVGTTTITYTATDASSNSATCTFTVTVVQEILSISCPNDTIVNTDLGTCTASVNNLEVIINSTITNIAGIQYTLSGATLSNGSGGLVNGIFELGITTVTFEVTDIFNNVETCSFTVTVEDNENPTINNCPIDMTVSATTNPAGGCGGIATWTMPTVSDNCDMNPQITSSHNSGAFFPVGQTTVKYYVIDASTNLDSCEFTVTVEDNIPPVFTNCPMAMTFSSAANCSTPVFWTPPTATDNCDNNLTITSSHTPGDPFMTGTETVVYTATDADGNVATCSFTITVTDNVDPQISCPADITVATNGNVTDPNSFLTGVNVISCDSVELAFGLPLGSDNCLNWTISQIGGPISGDTFLLGTNVLEFEIEDNSGNTTTCSFNLTVVPSNAFSISATPNPLCTGQDLQLETDTIAGTTYSWTGPANFTSNIHNPVITNVADINTGTYTVVITEAGSICSYTLTVDVTISETISLSITSDPTTLECTDGTQDITLTGVTSGPGMATTWEWLDPSMTLIDTDPVLTISNATSANAGIYTLIATGAGGCSDTVMQNVIITDGIQTAPTVSSDCDGFSCTGETCVLFGMFGGQADSVVWSATPEANAGLPSNLNTNSISINPTMDGQYNYSFTIYKDGCSSTGNFPLIVGSPANVENDMYEVEYETTLSDFDVTENDLPPPSFTITVSQDVAHGSLINNNNGTFSYTPDDGYIGVDQFIYQICVDCNNGEVCRFAVVDLEISFDGCLIPTVITPNNDGYNDALNISCALDNPDNELIVYNRWGDEVYRAAPYGGDWEGTYNGQELPDGTYYYVFKIDANDPDPKKGALTIMR